MKNKEIVGRDKKGENGDGPSGLSGPSVCGGNEMKGGKYIKKRGQQVRNGPQVTIIRLIVLATITSIHLHPKWNGLC